jgi:hypothetical protein
VARLLVWLPRYIDLSIGLFVYPGKTGVDVSNLLKKKKKSLFKII